MSVFDDNPYIKLGEPMQVSTPKSPAPDEVARGSFWGLSRRDGVYVLDYISGEIAGRAKSMQVSEEEAAQLKGGDDQLAIRIINDHGGG